MPVELADVGAQFGVQRRRSSTSRQADSRTIRVARHSESAPHSSAARVCGISCTNALANPRCRPPRAGESRRANATSLATPRPRLAGRHPGGRLIGPTRLIQRRGRPGLTRRSGRLDPLQLGDLLDQRGLVGMRIHRREPHYSTILTAYLLKWTKCQNSLNVLLGMGSRLIVVVSFASVRPMSSAVGGDRC